MSQELRIEHARRLLSDDLFTNSFKALKEQLTSEWLNTSQHDIDSREQLWLEIKLVDRLYTHIEAVFQEGEVKNFYNTTKGI